MQGKENGCYLQLCPSCTTFSSKSHAHWLFAGAELACVVLEIYKEAGAMACHSLTSYLHVTYTRCATTLAEAIPILKFLWKELCGECRHAIRAGTGDYTIVVMGCEMVVMMLVASVACKASSHTAGTICYLVAEPYSLCCAVLCCAVLCCAVLCCAVLCCAVCAVLCCAVCAVLCCLPAGDAFVCDSLYRLLVDESVLHTFHI